jgi:hypothetical protein
MSTVIDGSLGITYPDSSNQPAASSPYTLKNRIINGSMQIDQRNAGASVTPTVATYTLDRWFAGLTQASKYSVEQTISGVTAPTGFTNYLGITSTSAYSVLTGDIFKIQQAIEGFNIADLGWGTANAKTITISFWVRSSLTGTFGGSILNETAARNYPFTYTISSANTWEQQSVTSAGDTTGTWNSTNGVGMYVIWGLGVGSTFSGTAGAWAAGNIQGATGATSVVGTSGATFYITGVQLEVGSNATSFDYLPYGTELALCQRYYYKTPPAVVGTRYSLGQVISSTLAIIENQFPVPMRTSPTALEQNGTAAHYAVLNSTASGVTCSAVPTFNQSSNILAETIFTVASGITAGNATVGVALNTTSYLGWSAEL